MGTNFIKSIVILLIIQLVSISSLAQNVLEGSKGNSSIDYTQYGGGIISFNAADKKIELGYINYKYTKVKMSDNIKLKYSLTKPYWYGITVSGRALNDYATIFNNGKINPASNITLKYGHRLSKYDINNKTEIEQLGRALSRPDLTDDRRQEILDRLDALTNALPTPHEVWLIVRGGYNVSKFNIYDDARPFNEQFRPTRFNGFSGSVGLNYWHPNLFDKKLIFLAGLTVGLRRQNNIDDLNEITAEDITTITNSNTIRSFKDENVGFDGIYRAFTSIPINFDLYFKPHNLSNAAFSFYGRVNSFEDVTQQRQTPTNLGIGFYLLNENWLANPVGGVTFELRDTFKALSSNSFKDRIAFNIVTRVNIFQYNR